MFNFFKNLKPIRQKFAHPLVYRAIVSILSYDYMKGLRNRRTVARHNPTINMRNHAIAVVDTLTTARQLKEKGGDFYLEKENIYTLDAKGEQMITSMSSLTQEESRFISENVTWGHRKNFADGET